MEAPEDYIFSPKRKKLRESSNSTAVLVYNVSLNDMLVGTQPLPEMSARREFPQGLPGLARPVFSAQYRLANGLKRVLGDSPELVSWPQEGAADNNSEDHCAGRAFVPVGFQVPEGVGSIVSSTDLRFRRLEDASNPEQRNFSSCDGCVELSREHEAQQGESPLVSPRSSQNAATGETCLEEIPQILTVFFPLLATVVTAWLRGAAAQAQRRVVVLTSGRAAPRDAGADAEGNSTERTAGLMVDFLAAVHGTGPTSLSAVALHGEGDAFRYDANLSFCHEKLLPLLDREREDVATPSGDGWADRFRVTLALCDGPHSRLLALAQCLREFRPEMAHLTPLKAFWHSCVLRPADVDRESFARAFEAAPPASVDSLSNPRHKFSNPKLAALIAETVAHRNSFLFAQPCDSDKNNMCSLAGEHERFWLRKSHQPVLSVLMVQRDGGPVRFHRGINLEVAMPTGSLCAERNAIGTAFAADPSLRREDFRAITVLAVDYNACSPTGDMDASHPSCGRNPLSPCGACMEWLRKIYEVNPSFRVLTFEDETCRTVFVKTVGRMA